MPTFQYRAATSGGRIVRGNVDAASATAAQAIVQVQGNLLLSLARAETTGWRGLLAHDLGGTPKLRSETLARIIGRLASLLDAGLPAETALVMLSRDADHTVRRHVGELLRRLRSGSLLADAMSADAHAFPPVAIAMVRAGEADGALAAALGRLAEYLTKAEDVRRKVRSALIYPAALLLTAACSVLLVLTVVLPQLEPVFAETGIVLPTLTRFAFALSNSVRSHWVALVITTVALPLIVQRGLTQPALRLWRDTVLLSIPLLGMVVRQAEVARFGRTFGALLSGGVSLPTALELARPVLANQAMAEAVKQVTVTVREGSNLANPIIKMGLFPELAIQMIQVGEATGRLDVMSTRLADLLDADVQRALTRSLAMLVPALTIILGVLVGGIIASVMLAVLSVNQLVQ